MELIQKFKKKKICVIGDIILDRYVSGEVRKISPEAPIPVINENLEENYRSGGAANVANNIANLGANVVLCGVTGDDTDSKIIKDLLMDKGVNSDGIFIDDSRPTTRKMRILAQHPYHPHQQIVRVDREKTHDLPFKIENQIVNFISRIIKDIDLIIFSDYDKGLVTKNLATEIINLAKSNQKPILVDTKPNKIKFFNGCQWFTPNREEMQKITGVRYRDINDNENLKKIGEIFIKKVNPEYFVMTAGGEGMFLYNNKNEFKHVPTATKEVADVSGAGDTVVAVLGLCLACNLEPEKSVMLANRAAGAVVGKSGTATITISDLQNE